MRDWSRAFRPASFRGVGFRVQSEDMSGNRRLSVSPVAYSDRSVIEDMGRDPHGFQVTAYLVSDRADVEAKRLVSVLSVKGAGTLVLPMHGRVRARAVSWSRSRDKDRAGYVAFSIDFIEDGLSLAPFSLVPGVQILADLLSLGAAIVGAALAANYGATAWDRDRNRTAASAAERRAVTIIGVAKDKPSAAALDGFSRATAVVDDDVAGFGSAMLIAWRAHALSGDAADAYRSLEKEVLSPGDHLTGLAEQVCLAAALSLATVRRDYLAQQDAARTRESLSALLLPVVEASADLGADVFEWLSGVTGEMALELSRVAADRAPLVRVETGLSMSAARLAYDLYGDPARAPELVGRNKVATPVFMPVTFEAVAA